MNAVCNFAVGSFKLNRDFQLISIEFYLSFMKLNNTLSGTELVGSLLMMTVSASQFIFHSNPSYRHSCMGMGSCQRRHILCRIPCRSKCSLKARRRRMIKRLKSTNSNSKLLCPQCLQAILRLISLFTDHFYSLVDSKSLCKV